MKTPLSSLAQHSDTASAPAQPWLSFPRACLARARNPETSVRTGEKIGTVACGRPESSKELKDLGRRVPLLTLRTAQTERRFARQTRARVTN